METKIGLKKLRFREIGGEIAVFDRGDDVWFEL